MPRATQLASDWPDILEGHQARGDREMTSLKETKEQPLGGVHKPRKSQERRQKAQVFFETEQGLEKDSVPCKGLDTFESPGVTCI